jgi:hypothetical protein
MSDKLKLKDEKRLGIVSILVQRNIPFKFRSPDSLEDCLYWLRNESIGMVPSSRWGYVETPEITVTIESQTETKAHFVIYFRPVGRRSWNEDAIKTKYEGNLESLVEGDTLVQGQIRVPNNLAALIFIVIYVFGAVAIFQGMLAIPMGLFLFALILSYDYDVKRNSLQYIKTLLGHKHRAKV